MREAVILEKIGVVMNSPDEAIFPFSDYTLLGLDQRRTAQEIS